MSYTLYLDESYTHEKKGKNPAFAIGGFIINDKDIDYIEDKINDIKKYVWKDLESPCDVILHEMNLKESIDKRTNINKLKSEYKRFRDNPKKANEIYKEMSMIVKQSDISTIGCVVIEDTFRVAFPKEIQNEISLVCMQIIIENYVHFLFNNKSTGKIIYESRDGMDKTMLMRFYQICSIGTMYVQPQVIQQKINQFTFKSKKENDCCLQLADFIPNLIARKKSGKIIYPNVANLTNNILLKSYDGNSNNSQRYGIKVIPRME